MVILAWAARAAPVFCDPEAARALVEDARIDPSRIPVIQPNLLPGLARATAEASVVRVIENLCGDGDNVALVPAERWEGADFDAYSFVLTRSRTQGCVLEQEAAVLTVGVVDQELRVGLRGRLPPTVTPIGSCETPPSFREERVIAGLGTPVRVVVVSDHRGPQVAHTLVARRATQEGWQEQVLLDPAPERVVGGQGGPSIALLGTDDPWIVAHADRAVSQGCEPVPGQVVWQWQDESWRRLEGREALGRLADRGAWRLAGQDAWFLIVAQDSLSDRTLLEARARRLQRRAEEPLHLRESSEFPLFNAGYWIVSPDPWPTEAEARAAKKRWGRRTGAYVKRGWQALDPCEAISPRAGTAPRDVR